jgi:tetratricopeptide (TPR) repeat protein
MQLWRRCAELRPQEASVFYKAMGLTAANSGDSADAVRLFRLALQGSRDPQIPLLLAENLTQLGELREAADILETQLRDGAATPAALTELGKIELELERYERAQVAFQAAITADPNNKSAHYGLARSYARLDRPEESQRHLVRFQELEAQDSSRQQAELAAFDDQGSIRQTGLRTLIDTARCFRSHEQLTQAAEYLRTAAALAPHDVESRVELMTLYAQLGDDPHALDIAQQLRRTEPGNADHWMNVGVLSARLGKLDDGLTALRESLRIDPENRRYQEAYHVMRQQKK